MSGPDDQQFSARLAASAGEVAGFLDARLGDTARAGERAWPERLVAAMRHGVLNGGKRLRPYLVLETAAMLGGPEARRNALPVAAALECIHCYSLIHDDLPAMDDDDLRRGQPTVHIAFDEATAILAGDALLTLAFELLTDETLDVPAHVQVDLVRRLARAAGAGGMVGGQMLDLAAEKMDVDEAGVATLQAMKTGALLNYACVAGAVVADAPAETVQRMEAFGAHVGLAFQLADDLLDATADAAVIGKAAGKDASRGKATFVALNGIAATRARCAEMVEAATALLAPFGPASAPLAEAARFVVNRRS